jgi:1-deoxy-D-xylulose-5-phosphate synthase
MFEELGFKYIGPVDGHNAEGLVEVLRRVREMKGPVLLHVLTVKGKGHPEAEDAPHAFHGVNATGEPGMEETFTDVFSQGLVERAALDGRICAVTAAMPDGTGLAVFREQFPARFFDVGIAEAHAVTFAAGLAAGGMRPVVACYSSFLQRAYDNILHCVAAQGLPVIFAIDRAGAVAGDGETHQGLYDLAYLSHIPGLTVLAPTCAAELPQMLDYALALGGTVAIRYPRDAAQKRENVPNLQHLEGELVLPLHVAGSIPAPGGGCIAIVAVGAMLPNALEAARVLIREGYDAAVYNARFVKPIDMHMARELALFTYVFTVEDACVAGGYGAALREFIPGVRVLGFPDEFIGVGTRAQLFALHKLDASGIAEKIINTIKEN